MVRQWSVLGEGPGHAARQMALLFTLGTALTMVKALSVPADQRLLFGGLAALQAAAAAAGWWSIWRRLHPWAPLALALPAFVVLSASMWAAGGTVANAAPFFVLVFVWIGLHFPARAALAVAPVALLAYLTPLVAAGRPSAVLTSAVLFIPTLVAVAAVIARQVDHHRRDRAALHRAERWRAALTSTLAHDVRSPLTSVQFTLETLYDDIDDLPSEQRRELITMALRQTGRIRRLAMSLLDADRVDAEGHLRLDLQPVPLRAAIDEALAHLHGPVTVDMDDDVKVYADPQRLEQILINLTTNALRHGEPPIVISAAPTLGGHVAIQVRDHGMGVPEDKREALFSRFSSADTAPESVGLGLWITRQLARAHGGDVTYAPADPGACFTITLPEADPEPSHRAGARL
ncbi:HAMP domain-containing histidine kinase [Planomonospora sp. ID67723]|uniref:sensor histidine kinase n=1 Tax=Planomonospora sp. ID67723 TaxID=2738134 RepID=UPI0018C3F04C|nr:HAMP domain-containing sensor histidine kinase [Planomonospora sp. ID67723]MBG0828243.1 HAMP domain-containing histidine kinase [Planomonospora sp. ID67723]